MRWRAKFSHISPVWYQIRWNGTNFTLTGQHDVDAGWMARLKLPTEPVGDGGFPAKPDRVGMPACAVTRSLAPSRR